MGKNNTKFHIVMFPWFAMGHMTPFLHLANKLAALGHRTTFLLPHKAKLHLDNLNLHPSLITLHPITVPHVSPLPPDTQTASDIPIHLTSHLASALDLTRPQVESLVSGLNPDFLFYDMAHWAPQVAALMGHGKIIKTVCYNVVCAASLAIALVPGCRMSRPPPGYPSKDVVLEGPEAKSLLFVDLPFGDNITFYDRITSAMASADAIAIRTCKEIEGNFCDYVGAQYNKPVFLTGPVFPEPETNLEAQWAEWLERFEPKKVIFCAFGSQFVLDKAQFQEMVLGFEMTGLPFLVAVKPPTGCESVEEALPDGFIEQVGERGKVTDGWVPQPAILSHPSVGCFVNHCGFGSMWESLMSDAHIVLVPQLGDQILNTKLMANELKVAVEVEKGEDGWVSKEGLCKTIKCVMDEGSEVGELVRKNHAKWKEVLVEHGLMEGYIDNFVKNLETLVS